ncbi:hypothetical protein IED13_01080 [Bosea sp. SSUT16]|uniref:Uncharacterized protein n=1 Tax=Bosea spartocytisi TaxID=2773451 RepID=A0A927HYE4_9HYPH|nr:hypothetical protein [Bosea spartocytisi]MBD3844272.1 hypothetical protein [Bosea spartocytisi]MCT4470622.1 hypothetical protein [Bosea spartocytisi]
MAAAYEWTASCTDDETYIRTLTLLKSDGSLFEVDDYAFEYSLKGCGADLLLDETGGISKNALTATLTISPGVDVRLQRGTYNHGLRKRNLATGQVDQIADGTLTVTEGNF